MTRYMEPLLGEKTCDRDAKQRNVVGTTWQRMAAVMIANILGTGVLGLPFAASKLGWLPFLGTLAICTAGAFYSGMLYARLYQAAPSSLNLADVARAALGTKGGRLVSTVAYVYIAGVVIIFHLTTTLAVNQVVASEGICLPYVSLAVVAPVLGLLQLRQMHSVGGISILGAVAILVPCLALLVVMLSPPQEGHTELVAEGSTWVRRGVSVMDVVFAYSGQVIFIELQSEMRTPETFPKAVGVSTAVMVVTYLAISGVCYWAVGAAGFTDGRPITSHVSDPVTLRFINLFLAVHVVIAYTIEGNVLARGVCWMLGLERAISGRRRQDRLLWFMITAGIVGLGFVVSNSLPFFSDVMGLLAALCSILLSYTIPACLFLKLCDTARTNRLICQALIPISLFVALAGTVASGADIMAHLHHSPPFSCHPN